MSNMNSDFFWSSNFLLVRDRLVTGRCSWLVIGWSIGWWSVVGGRLVDGFKETPFWHEFFKKDETLATFNFPS